MLLVLASLAVWPSYGQTSGLAILRIGLNADASAMGDAHVAIAEGAFATYWNPAGLAVGSIRAVGFSHRRWIGDLRMYDLAARFVAGKKAGLGLAVTASDSGDLEVRDRPGDPAGTFSAQYISAGVSYGRSVGPLRWGATAKYLKERFFDADASGYAIDAGVQADLVQQSVAFGAALRNVGRMSKLEREATTLPRTIQAGVALHPLHILADWDGTKILDVMVAADVSYLTPSKHRRLHIGKATTVLEMVVLRLGYVTNDELRSVTAGLGVLLESLIFDYAYIPFESGFEGPGHILTLAYSW